MKRTKVYLFLPLFAAFAIFSGSMLYADVDVVAERGRATAGVDMEALKAELKSELMEELRAELLSDARADIQRATEEATSGITADIQGHVTRAMEESGILSGLFKGVTAGGFIDVNYMYNLRNHGEGAFTGRGAAQQQRENTNGTMNFVGENEENTFVLENFAMFLDKEATDEHPIGWQMHTYWGEKAKRITFSGPGPNGFGTAAGGGTSDVDRDDIFTLATANITWNVPVGGSTVPVTMGKMYTWIGYELVENIGNPNYSHGTVYNNAIPFTHMGMSFDVSEFLPSDKWGLTLYAVNGWDSFMDNTEGLSYGSYLTYEPNDDFFISLATIWGPEGWGARGGTGHDATMMYDVVVTYSLPQVENLSLGFNWDHGYSEETDLSGVQNGASGAHWWAAVGYAMYDFTDNQQGALRYEYFDDDDGAKFFGHSMWTVTYTQNMTIRENFLLRPEIRYNKYNVSDSQQNNLGMGLAPGDKGNTADDEFIIGVGAEYVF